MHDATAQKLMDDLRAVVSDAEALVAATAGEAGGQTESARKRAAESLAHARARLQALEQQAKERVTAAVHEADHYVHENPWQSIAVAAGVGALVGFLLARR
jgi:ElaB/YqjD/DUF883 family membrane-anchored ribosome-binding protein